MSGQGNGYRGGQRRTYAARPQAPVAAAPKPTAKVVVIGKADLWVTLQTVRDGATGISKRTQAMAVPGGVLINTCTRGAGFATEALAHVPGVGIRMNTDGKTGSLFATLRHE